MPMEEDLVARLLGDETLMPIVSDRISWFDRQGGPSPADAKADCLTLAKISPGREWNHAGPDGLDGPRVQVDCWAAAETGAVALARAVLALMEQYQETGGTAFWPAQLLDETWSVEGEEADGATIARVRLDFQFYHERI